jgi:hypothetical protein
VEDAMSNMVIQAAVVEGGVGGRVVNMLEAGPAAGPAAGAQMERNIHMMPHGHYLSNFELDIKMKEHAVLSSKTSAHLFLINQTTKKFKKFTSMLHLQYMHHCQEELKKFCEMYPERKDDHTFISECFGKIHRELFHLTAVPLPGGRGCSWLGINFKDFIVVPVLAQFYNNRLPEAFFTSKGVLSAGAQLMFQEWLTTPFQN